MTHLHCRTRIWILTRIRIPNHLAILYFAEYFTLHGLWLGSLLAISVKERNPSWESIPKHISDSVNEPFAWWSYTSVYRWKPGLVTDFLKNILSFILLNTVHKNFMNIIFKESDLISELYVLLVANLHLSLQIMAIKLWQGKSFHRSSFTTWTQFSFVPPVLLGSPVIIGNKNEDTSKQRVNCGLGLTFEFADDCIEIGTGNVVPSITVDHLSTVRVVISPAVWLTCQNRSFLPTWFFSVCVSVCRP